MSDIPDWADKRFSEDLPTLRAKGESQEREFKRQFPDHANDLGKEIAAFATSNAGVILLGVDADGGLVGLPDASTPAGRDRLIGRIQGICSKSIKPPITPRILWAVEDDSIVMVILVPKGEWPLYLCQNIPYVRHVTEARPAEPNEILELHRAYLAATPEPGSGQDQEKNTFYSRLFRIVSTISIYGHERAERELNPWFEQWRSEYGHLASVLREMSASGVAIEEQLVADLRHLADRLDAVATFRVCIGCGAELDHLVESALAEAGRIERGYLELIPLSRDSTDEAQEMLRVLYRKTEDLSARAETLVESGRVEELQAEASSIGYQLLQVSYYCSRFAESDFSTELCHVAQQLHLTETLDIRMDGGASERAVMDRVRAAYRELASLIEALQQSSAASQSSMLRRGA